MWHLPSRRLQHLSIYTTCTINSMPNEETRHKKYGRGYWVPLVKLKHHIRAWRYIWQQSKSSVKYLLDKPHGSPLWANGERCGVFCECKVSSISLYMSIMSIYIGLKLCYIKQCFNEINICLYSVITFASWGLKSPVSRLFLNRLFRLTPTFRLSTLYARKPPLTNRFLSYKRAIM